MAEPNVSEQRYRPLICLKPESGLKYPLIVLNQPLDYQREHLDILWKHAFYHVATDGANNRLYDIMQAEGHEWYIPDLLTGDFDSIKPEVKSFMSEKGARVEETKDQDYTDFSKSLMILKDVDIVKNTEIDCIVAFAAFGGRLDHTLSNLNTLFEHQANTLDRCPLYLIGDHNLSFLLTPGRHVIEVNTGLEGDYCGLIPLGERCNDIKTTGLKWNLTNNEMKFGGLISTSNGYESAETREVTIETDSPVLWIMSIKH